MSEEITIERAVTIKFDMSSKIALLIILGMVTSFVVGYYVGRDIGVADGAEIVTEALGVWKK